MQYLKDDVRNSIEESALREFKSLGYKGASIRSIAKNSNTSVGNFYKYFKGKDELFESLIGPVYDSIMDYIGQFEMVELGEGAENIFYSLMEKILEIFNEKSRELSILFNKSGGSKYENCKAIFVEFITRVVTGTMEYQLSLMGKSLKDNFIIHVVSYSFVEGIGEILEKKEDGAEVHSLAHKLIDIFFMDIINKLDIQ